MTDDPVEHLSALPFEEVEGRLQGAITGAGLTLFARIDHAAGARAAGLEMPPAIVLIYGAARGGTPAMLAAPNAALDLPLRVLIRTSGDGRTVIVFHPARTMLERYDVPPDRLRPLEGAQSMLLAALAS